MIFLFDLDGTLVNTDEIYYKVWTKILMEYNIDMTKELYDTYIQGHSDESVINSLEIKVNEITTLKDTYFMEYLEEITVIPYAIEFLENVKKKDLKMAIVTNCSRRASEEILKKLKIIDYFEIIVIGSECSRPKPYPDPYLLASKKLNDKIFIIFEDSKTGLLSAKSSGASLVIGIETNYNKEILIEYGADYTLKDFNIQLNIIIDMVKNNPNELISYINNSLNNSLNNIIIHLDKLKGGFISDVISVSINNKEAVLKLENKNENFLSIMANNIHLYSREYYFYESISPYVPLEIPEKYSIVKDSNFFNIGILMKNMFHEGYVIKKDFDINDSLFLIENISKLHIKFWNLPINSFPNLMLNKQANSYWTGFINNKWDLFKKKWSRIIPINIIELFEEKIKSFEDLHEIMSKDNLTLCHGDLKTTNIFYKKENEKINMCFIDWQYITRGKGVQDIVFFMIESFTPEQIKKYNTIIKEYYYIKLIEGNIIYPRNDFEKDFENSIFYFPLFVAVWFGTLDNDELIDKNFPFFFIQRYINFLKINITKEI